MTPINDTVWGAFVGTIVDSVISENNNNIHKAKLTGNQSGISSADETAPWWLDILTAAGGAATAAALFVVAYQAKLTRRQTDLMQQSIGRAWIGGGADPRFGLKVVRNVDRLVLYCKNYGQLPARISWVKSTISESQLNELQVRTAPENPSEQIIFPNHQVEFSTRQKVDIKHHEDKIIWVGFIVRYEATSESVGEYGIMEKYISGPAGAYFEQTGEWFESR
jgi:hypothetical protein